MKSMWEICRLKYGDEQKALELGWEPFAITSEPFQIEKGKQYDTVYSCSVYVYLRRLVISAGTK
jgi:hypothetical protein